MRHKCRHQQHEVSCILIKAIWMCHQQEWGPEQVELWTAVSMLDRLWCNGVRKYLVLHIFLSYDDMIMKISTRDLWTHIEYTEAVCCSSSASRCQQLYQCCSKHHTIYILSQIASTRMTSQVNNYTKVHTNRMLSARAACIYVLLHMYVCTKSTFNVTCLASRCIFIFKF